MNPDTICRAGIAPEAANALCGIIVDSITAAGSGQSDATLLTGDVNIITAGTGGVRLPNSAKGTTVKVYNESGATLSIYPATGGAINTGGTNTALSIATAKSVELVKINALEWFSFPKVPT